MTTRPRISISANKVDRTARLAERITGMTIEDQAGFKSDRLILEIADPGNELEWPGKGVELGIAIAAPGGDLVPQGTFSIDQVTAPLFGGSLTIGAAAARFPESFKTARSAGWRSVSLGDLVNTIGARHGFDARVDPELAAVEIPHLTQTSESDMHLLTRLSKEYGALMKPASGRLLFLKRGAGRNAAGDVMPEILITPADVVDGGGSITATERDQYTAVEATYRDLDAAELKTVTVGSGSPVFRLRNPYSSQADAFNAARARLEKIERGKANLNVPLHGDPRIAAEGRIRLEGFRDGATGRYSVSKAIHRFGEREPFKTMVTAELVERL